MRSRGKASRFPIVNWSVCTPAISDIMPLTSPTARDRSRDWSRRWMRLPRRDAGWRCARTSWSFSPSGGGMELALMVGDSVTDIRMAREAAIPVVAVDFGYTETPVALLAPVRIISRFDDLPAAVSQLLRPPR